MTMAKCKRLHFNVPSNNKVKHKWLHLKVLSNFKCKDLWQRAFYVLCFKLSSPLRKI